MGFDLTNERIQDTYEQLVQISGSSLVDGTGSALPAIDNITVVSASYATTASFALNAGAEWDDITGKPAGLVSASAQVDYTAISNVPSGILSSSAQIADDISGSFTSTSASIATDIASNVSSISTNAGNISTNTSNISTNTSNISTLTGETSSYAVKTSNNTFTGTQTFNNIAVNGTGSFAVIESVTGSAKIIGDAFIILNNNTPTERYAGVVVQDSGSTNNTASLEFDGQTNDWFYEYTDDGGATAEHGVVMFGPGYNTKGSHVYPSNNTILKGTGDHHIVDSNISDDGTTIGMTGNVDLNSGGAIIISDYTGSLASTSVLIGHTNNDVTLVNPTGTKNVQIGSNVRIVESSQRNDVVAIGGDISAAQETISIGHTITNNTAAGIAIGNNVSLTSNNEINIGGAFKYDGSTTTTLTGNIQGGGSSTLSSGNRRISYGTNNNVTEDDSIAIGGESNTVGAGYSAIIGGASNNLSSGDTSGIFVGYQNTLNGGSRNAIIGGESVTNGQNFTIVLGRQSFTAPNEYTTYVANLDASGSAVISGSITLTSEEIVNVSSGSATGSLIDNVHPAIASGSSAIKHIVTIDQTAYDTISGSGDVNDDTFYIISDAGDDVYPGNLQVEGQIYSPTFAGTIASSTSSISFDNGNFATLNCASSTFLANPTNLQGGTTYTLIVTNGANISGYGTVWKFAGGTEPTLSANTDVITAVSDGTSLYAAALADFS